MLFRSSYSSYEEFEARLEGLLLDNTVRERHSLKAREYFLRNYSLELYRKRLAGVFGAVPEEREGRGPGTGAARKLGAAF